MLALEVTVPCGLNPRHPSEEIVIWIPDSGLTIRRGEKGFKVEEHEGELDYLIIVRELEVEPTFVHVAQSLIDADHRFNRMAERLDLFSQKSAACA